MSRHLEVWGDTVDSRHMALAVALGAGIAAPTFLLARWVFSRTVDDQTLAGSYALLLGLAGCVLAAVVAARLFPPKRVVRESSATLESRQEALDSIAAQGGEWTDPAGLAPQVQQELRQLGLYEVLAEAHEQSRARSAEDGRAGEQGAP